MKTPVQHPYFIYDDLRDLRDHRRDMPAGEATAMMERVALNSPDPRAEAAFADISGDDWQHLYPAPATTVPDTDSAIDTFLNTYGHAGDKETALLERLIFNPTPDYASVLVAQEEKEAPSAPVDEQDILLDAFLSTHPADATHPQHTAPADVPPPPPTPAAPAPAPSHAAGDAPDGHARGEGHEGKARMAASSSLRESLAKIYIRQGRYSKAYDIIYELNLKNPKKSAYFADQLRFLQKIMAVEAQRSARAAK